MSFALMRAGAASSRWNPSLATRAIDFRGDAAPRERFTDAKQSSGARDRCEHRVGIKRLHAAQIHDFDFNPSALNCCATASASCTIALLVTMLRSRPGLTIRALPMGSLSVGQRVGLEVVIKIFVLAVDDRVVDRDRVDQHRVGIFDRRGGEDDQPG